MLSQGCPFRWGQHWQMALPYVGAHLTRCALELPRAGNNMSYVYICIVSVVLRWSMNLALKPQTISCNLNSGALPANSWSTHTQMIHLVVLTRATQNVHSQALKANQHEQTTWNCNLLVCMLSSEFYSCSYWLLHCHKQCSSGPILYMYVWCMYVCMYNVCMYKQCCAKCWRSMACCVSPH